MDMDKKKERTHMIVAGIAGLLVGFLAGWLWVDTEENPAGEKEIGQTETIDLGSLVKEGQKETTGEATTPTPTPVAAKEPAAMPLPSTNTPTDDAMIVVAQQLAGTEVTLGALSLPQKYWVAIHEDTQGRPAKILGAKSFAAGTHTGVKMKLVRATVPGQAYYAMLHADDGDGKFDAQKDMPVTKSGGAPVMVRFETNTAQ